MAIHSEAYQTLLEQICTETIGPHAPEVDRLGHLSGPLPRRPEEAAGLLGAVSAARSVASDWASLAPQPMVRRVAQECGSTAMVLCMHYCGAAVLEAHGAGWKSAAPPPPAIISAPWPSAKPDRAAISGRRSAPRRADGGDVVAQRAQELGHLRLEPRPPTCGRRKPLGRRRAEHALAGAPPTRPGSRQRTRSTASACAATIPRPSRAEARASRPCAMLGSEDGKGFDIMMGVVLPCSMC